MTASWPDDLPQGTPVDGFKSGTRGTRLGTAMEVGPPKFRPRGPKTRTIAFNDLFTADERARLDRFWDEDLNQGTAPFFYRDPHSDGFPLLDDAGNTLQDEAGNDIIMESWILCVFSDQAEPQWGAAGGGWFTPQFQLTELP
ncbi:hypothetical protein ACWAT4_26495 [Bradyrhizobium manausense]